MKKSVIFSIILIIIALLIISTFFYNFIFFKAFHKSIRPATGFEQQKVIEILKEQKGFESSQIVIGNVIPLKNREIIEAEVTINNSKEHYLIDPVNREVTQK